MNASGIKQAFESFMSDEKAVCEAIDMSTIAGYSGSGYSVELFDDGHHRLLWDNQIGNRYDSPGVIIHIPKLTEDEVETGDAPAFYDNAIEALRENFEYAMEATS